MLDPPMGQCGNWAMDIKPTKSEPDHEAAPKEMDRLIDAKAGTRDGERLGALTALVEAWEEKHHGPLALGLR